MRAGVVLLLGALVGPAVAQPGPEPVPTQLELLLGVPPEPVAPTESSLELPVEVRYSFVEAAPGPADRVEVALTAFATEPWAVVTVSPAIVHLQPDAVPCGCARTLIGNATLLVAMTADAPAYRRNPIAVLAEAAPHGPYAASRANETTEVVSGFLSVLELRGPEAIELAAGERRPVDITVANFGNAVTLVRFGGSTAAGVALVSPRAITLGARQAGDGANVGHVQWVVHNQGLRAPFDITLTALGSLSADPKIPGSGAEWVVEVVPTGLVGLPAVESGALLAGLVLAARAARRARD